MASTFNREPRSSARVQNLSRPPSSSRHAIAPSQSSRPVSGSRPHPFDHRGSNGSSVGQRVRQQGYQGSAVGENISKGHSTAREVVDGWLRSPGHCNNIMSPDFSQLGVGLIGNTWTQVFAHPF
ncbi:hypothetical protein C2W62_40205 [Candidatus Entotheonella serta]|nr:hypothetical protein C2W62_40205 [Candidatus Entotheonella serta]